MYYGLINSMKRGIASNPLWNNLIAYFTGDNTSSDALGINNGTLVNGATYSTGKINNGFSLDGINDYINLPSGMFNPSGSYSISLWFSSLSMVVDAFKPIFVLGNTLLTNSVIVYLYNNGGTTVIRLLNSNNTTFQFIEYPLPSFNVFHHVCCVKDTVSNKYYIYLNGGAVAQAAITVNYVANNNSIRLGNLINGYYGGIIDEVGIWDGKALTSTEVTELYNSGSGKQYPL